MTSAEDGARARTRDAGADDRADDALDEAVARLARRAHERNVDRVERAAELLAAPGTPLGDAARDEAAQLCHTVAGSAGTFGDAALTEAARRLETVLRDARDADVPAALDRLRDAARRASA
ncbi:Hpt domain-containing protein [Promicromonospora sp. Marseille-Q5078]